MKRLLSLVIVAALVLLSPGLAGTQAFAAAVNFNGSAPVAVGAPLALPRLGPSLPQAPEFRSPFTGAGWTRRGNHLLPLPYYRAEGHAAATSPAASETSDSPLKSTIESVEALSEELSSPEKQSQEASAGSLSRYFESGAGHSDPDPAPIQGAGRGLKALPRFDTPARRGPNGAASARREVIRTTSRYMPEGQVRLVARRDLGLGFREELRRIGFVFHKVVKENGSSHFIKDERTAFEAARTALELGKRPEFEEVLVHPDAAKIVPLLPDRRGVAAKVRTVSRFADPKDVFVTFEVEPGETVVEIDKRVEQAGLVPVGRSEGIFHAYRYEVWLKGRDTADAARQAQIAARIDGVSEVLAHPEALTRSARKEKLFTFASFALPLAALSTARSLAEAGVMAAVGLPFQILSMAAYARQNGHLPRLLIVAAVALALLALAGPLAAAPVSIQSIAAWSLLDAAAWTTVLQGLGSGLILVGVGAFYLEKVSWVANIIVGGNGPLREDYSIDAPEFAAKALVFGVAAGAIIWAGSMVAPAATGIALLIAAVALVAGLFTAASFIAVSRDKERRQEARLTPLLDAYRELRTELLGRVRIVADIRFATGPDRIVVFLNPDSEGTRYHFPESFRGFPLEFRDRHAAGSGFDPMSDRTSTNGAAPARPDLREQAAGLARIAGALALGASPFLAAWGLTLTGLAWPLALLVSAALAVTITVGGANLLYETKYEKAFSESTVWMFLGSVVATLSGLAGIGFRLLIAVNEWLLTPFVSLVSGNGASRPVKADVPEWKPYPIRDFDPIFAESMVAVIALATVALFMVPLDTALLLIGAAAAVVLTLAAATYGYLLARRFALWRGLSGLRRELKSLPGLVYVDLVETRMGFEVAVEPGTPDNILDRIPHAYNGYPVRLVEEKPWGGMDDVHRRDKQ